MRVNETENEGVSDTLPKELQIKKRKRSAEKIMINISPSDIRYSPLQFAPWVIQTTIQDREDRGPLQLMDYFLIFLPKWIYSLLARHINRQASNYYRNSTGSLRKNKNRRRQWKQVKVSEICVFIDIYLQMGLVRLPQVEDYWIKAQDSPIFHEIFKLMSLYWWQQIWRFFKISDPGTEGKAASRFMNKLKLIWSHFQKACVQNVISGQDISFDKQLLLCKFWSEHIMTIFSKRARQGFKIYVAFSDSYICDFWIAFKKSGIIESKDYSGRWNLKHFWPFISNPLDLPLTQTVIINIMKSLPQNEYVIYIDKFFTFTKLLRALKS